MFRDQLHLGMDPDSFSIGKLLISQKAGWTQPHTQEIPSFLFFGKGQQEGQFLANLRTEAAGQAAFGGFDYFVSLSYLCS